MTLRPFDGAEPSNILALLARDYPPEEIVSVQFRCEVRPPRSDRDEWQRLQAVLSHPAVYAAMEISTLAARAEFRLVRELEAIGALANLLRRRNIVASNDVALMESQRCLDSMFRGRYDGIEAFTCHQSWCDWFADDWGIDETLLFNSGHDWWLLAVTRGEG